MAKAWKDVASDERFRALPPEQRKLARDEYFNTVVAPQVSYQEKDKARGEFEAASDLDIDPSSMIGGALEGCWAKRHD
jgi:hypothetical protein